MEENNNQRLQELELQKIQLQKLLQDMRHKRHCGTDDDRAEDFMEEYYRELLDVEAEIDYLKHLY